MDEPLDLVAHMDQIALFGIRELARVAASYYEAALEQCFDTEQAMALVLNWQTAMILSAKS